MRAYLAISALMLALNFACSRDPGSLREAARLAKQQGRATAGLLTICECQNDQPLDGLLRLYSVLHVRATGVNRAVTHTPEAIFTWHAFQVVRQLSLRERPQGDVRCGRPRAVEIQPGEMVAPLVGGTTDIEGVPVSMAPPPAVTVESNHEYLLLAILCGNGVLELPHGEQDVFGVDANGRILPTPNAGRSFVRDLVALGTVDAVADRVRTLSR